ncbi:hypothetical protein SO802_023801 [Lithocarpus litseifolius]|uniref:F-box domain-containing protein n=1 Tax=Lithocarpus litseifolius TaxID=425828 RepID=A0AAW2C9F5_9ROSI
MILRRRTKQDLPDKIVLEILATLPVKSLLNFRFSWTRTKWMPPPEVEVYSLSSDSWKRVELGISWRPNVISYGFNGILAFPFVSGHLHRMIEMIEEGGGQEKHETSMILSFDVNSEKFIELPLPDDEGGHIAKCLTSYKEKLALIKFEHGAQPLSKLCSIWVMREYGVLDSWNKLCVLPIEMFTDFIGFTKYVCTYALCTLPVIPVYSGSYTYATFNQENCKIEKKSWNALKRKWTQRWKVVRALIKSSSSNIRSRRSLCLEILEASSRRMALANINMEIDQFGIICALIAGWYNWYQFAPKCVCFIVYASRK